MHSAERDVAVANLALEAEPALAAFHAQQAAGKSLEAAAIATTGDHAQTHSVGAIVSELRRLGIAFENDVQADARALDFYYSQVATRTSLPITIQVTSFRSKTQNARSDAVLGCNNSRDVSSLNSKQRVGHKFGNNDSFERYMF